MTQPREALIVAHGAPADPDSLELSVGALASAVAARLPGWRVRAATLAAPGALERACAATGAAPMVYPLFMSAGWFSTVELPRRLAAAGAAGARVLSPLGLDPGLPALGAAMLAEAAQAAGLRLPATTLVLAAHGAPEHRGPSKAARAAAEAIAAAAGVAAVRTCFVDEPPFLVEGLSIDDPAICLPFFATAAGHVTGDLPEAVAEAGFSGPVLPPIGCDPRAADLISAALSAALAAAA